MNSKINNEQNKKEYLRYRYVCRKLYTNEKKYRNLIILGGIISYIIGLIPNIPKFLSILPIIWIVVGEIIKRKLQSIHKDAVDYHEYNDRVMFGLSQLTKLLDRYNSLYQGAINLTSSKKDKIKFEEMVKKEHKTSIRNWYNDFKEMPEDIAIIMAQDENINWEKNQRIKYKVILTWLLVLIFGCSTIIIYLLTDKINSIVFIIPIAWECLSLLLDNNESLKRCDGIIEKIGEIYAYIRMQGKEYSRKKINEEVVNIQLKIYENRKDSIPVPDRIYKLYRDSLQKESNEYIKSIKNDIKNNIK